MPESIRWSNSLKARITAPFVLLLVAAVLFGAWGARLKFEAQLIKQIETRGTLAGVILGDAVESLRDYSDVRRIVSVVGGEPNVALALVVGGTPPKVLASSRRAWVGEAVENLPSNVAHLDDIQTVLKSRAPVREFDREGSVFHYAAPLLLPDPDNLAARANGVVIIHFDTRSTEAEAADAAWTFTMQMAAGVMMVWGLLFVAIHRAVLRPVTGLRDWLAERDARRKPPEVNDDEIGLLARSLKTSMDGLERHQDALVRLHEITADAELPPQEKIQRLLNLGLDLFGMDLGLVSRIRGEEYMVMHSAGEGAPDHGVTFDLGETYCANTLVRDGPLAIDHMGASDFSGHPCYEKFQLESYIGAPIRVEGARWGTLSFSSAAPSDDAFQEADRTLILLFAEWMGGEMTRAGSLAALVKSEESLRALIDNVIDGIITADEKGKIQSFNPAAERIFGYRAEEVMGQNLTMLMPEPYRSEHDGYLRRYHDTNEARIIGIGREVEGRRRDGTTFPLELGVSEVRLETGRLFLGIIRDITERKEVERMRTEFISTVNHELRTPLTSIQGSLALINKANPDGLEDKHRKLLDIAYRNCGRLVRLINDILDINKMEAGRMTYAMAPQRVLDLFVHTVEANASFTRQFDVSLEIDRVAGDPAIMADPDRIQQVLTNLVSNAAKFSNEGGTVTLSARSADGAVRMSVTDRGDGIPKDFQNNIFGKFSQADASTTRKREGSGLGLAICKIIVEQHGGKIWFDTEEGAGTTFHVEIPTPTDEKGGR